MWSTMKGFAFVAGLAMCASTALAGGGPPPNDFCTEPSTATCGTNSGSNQGATGQIVADCATSNIGNSNVWWEFVAPVTGTYTINTLGSGLSDTVLAVFTGCEGAQLACNDDISTSNFKSEVQILLSSGQRVLIEVSDWGTSINQGSIQLNILCPGEEVCCQPWDNGRPDLRTAQTSQIGFGEDYRVVGRVTADDFWLCEGNIYRIRNLRAQLSTDSVVPKADVIILEDCDGRPGNPVAEALSVLPPTTDPSLECLYGTVTITDTNAPDSDGFRLIDIEASWDRLFLKGGAYWVIVYGYSGTADPDEQFFWPSSGNQIVKGKPGQFAELDETTEEINWISTDEICCGCTDFNFCLLGEACKILLDNGGPLLSLTGPDPASPSLQTGSTAQVSRSADQFVVPPCDNQYLCYAEAWVWTNCDRIAVDLFRNDCKLPVESTPEATFEAHCVFSTDITRFFGNQELTLKKAVFFDFGIGAPGYLLEGGHNYWFSAYGLGENRQNARAFFAHNYFCDRTCWINFEPGATKGPPYVTGQWRSTADLAVGPHDFAFLVAIHQLAEPTTQLPPDLGIGACRADFNGDGTASLQDLFDFLGAYFSGCP